MMKPWSKILVAAAAVCFAAAAHAADVTEHHRLANGLDVRLFPRPGTPLVATLVLVRTGYALEEPGSSGHSHLLEHLVFAGTEKMNKQELFEEVERLGGYLNGYTRDDYMGYLMVGHRESYRRQAELLAEILFHASVSEEAVAEAKEVVLEEIRRRQSRPDTRAEEMFQALLYAGSSYERTGLGSEESVSSASREELVDTYRRVYRPDNMILVAAGGVSEEETMAVLEETFGAARPGAAPGSPAPPPPLRGQRTYTLRSELPEMRVRIGFNGPHPWEKDAEVLALLGGVLGGDGGRIMRALERAGLDPRSVSAGLQVNTGFSRFVISAGFPSGTEAAKALQAILDEVDLVSLEGPTEGEVHEAREALRAAEVLGAEKLHYFLMGKAPWIVSGAPGQGLSVRRWDMFEPGDLQTAAGSYLAGRPYAALLALPGLRKESAGTEKELNRERRVLGNGLVVVAEERPGSEVFAVNILTRRRSSVEPAGKAGIADFLHRMLPRGTASRTKAEIDEELRKTGASLVTAGNPMVPFGDFYTSRSYSFIRAECLDEHAEAVVELVADMVRSASFSREEIDAVRSRMEEFLSYRDASPGTLAGRLLAERIYGPGAFGNDVLGERTSVVSVTGEDLATFRQHYFTGRNLIVSVVSGREPSEAVRLVTAYFDTLPPGEVPQLRLAQTSAPEVVERELGKPQGALAAGAVVGEADPQVRTALTVVNGLLNERLNRELREREGLAYSVGASLGVAGGMAVFSFSMGTSAEKMERARAGLRREIEAARGMTVGDGELERRVSAITGRLQMRSLSSLNRGFYLALAEQMGLAHTFGEDYRRLLLELTPGDVEAAARTFLPRDMVEVVVR